MALVSLNFHGYEIDIEKAARILEGTEADFLCLQEVWTRKQLASLERSLPDYKFAFHSEDEAQGTHFRYGVILAWKRGWVFERLPSPAGTVAGIARKGERALLLVSVHGFKVHGYGPLDALNTATGQASQMGEIEALALGQEISLPILIGGDFNAPASGPAFKVFPLRKAFARTGRGFGATFPAKAPFIQIDHVLGSKEVGFKSLEIFDAGSDHLGLLVRFDLNGD